MRQQLVLLSLVLQEEVRVMNKLAISGAEEHEVIEGMALNSMKFTEETK